MRRLLLLLLAALAAATASPAPAEAHAALVLAEPAPGAVMTLPPNKILLEFSERLDPAFSRLRLLDERGQVLAETTEVSPVRPVRLLLELGPLPEGSYTAVWRVRSAEDGHVTEGVVPFGVGVAADLSAVLPAPGSPAPTLAPPDLVGLAGRWLALVGVGLAVGALGFGLLAWRPAWRAAPGSPEADALMGRTLRRLALAGSILVAAGAPLTLLSQALSVSGPGEPPLAALPGLLAGAGGMLIGGRLLMAGALALLAHDLGAPGGGGARGWAVALAVGAPLLLTFPLTGHGAAAGDLAPALVAAGFAHVAAMALWLGGLPGLFAAVRQARAGAQGPALPALVRRFSIVAVAAVLAAAATGAVAAWAHVGSPELLAATTYGRALLAKSAIFAALLGLGALHMLVVGPRLRPGGPWAARFRLTLGLELALAAALLLAAAAQLSTAPSVAALEAERQVGRRLEALAGAEPLVLWVTPAQVGDNLLALDLAEEASAGGEPLVLFRFTMPGHAMAPLEAEAAAAGGGRFQARGGFLSMVGRWEVETIVRRAGRPDARHTFTVDVRGR